MNCIRTHDIFEDSDDGGGGSDDDDSGGNILAFTFLPIEIYALI